MKVIGLTGGTGSGKSVVSKSLAAAGAVVIDADKIAHEIILKGEPAYQEIVKYYGTGILDAKGNIIGIFKISLARKLFKITQPKLMLITLNFNINNNE